MTQHATYTERFLTKKGLSHCKMIASELGAVPSGDKRQLATWIDAIIKHQGSNSQPDEVEAPIVASIEYDHNQLTEPYLVVVVGEVVHQRNTYMNAVRYCEFQGYKLVDPTEVAQSELEAELEAQAHERGEELQFVSPDGFSEYLAYEKGVMVGRVSRNTELDDDQWVAEVAHRSSRFEFYDDAEEFVKNNHLGKLEERGSGRVSDEGVSIDDWRPIANQIIKMTKHEYLLAA